MKLRISEFVKSPRAAYAALFCVMLACHLQFLYVPGDEVGYAAALGGNWNFASMFAYVGGHYWTWSARMLTESLFCIFSAAPVLVWRVVNPAVITACAWLMAYALQSEKRRTESWLLCALVFLHQWVNLKTAGWVVTTIAYLWPICFGLAALCPLWRLVRGKRTPAWGWVLACISLLFAANMEQPALVLPFLVAGGMLFLHARGVRVPAGLWVQLAICAASLVFIFTCPGNAMRTENDITSFYMNYPMLSVLQKAEIGISGVVHASVLGREMLFFLLAVHGRAGVGQAPGMAAARRQPGAVRADGAPQPVSVRAGRACAVGETANGLLHGGRLHFTGKLQRPGGLCAVFAQLWAVCHCAVERLCRRGHFPRHAPLLGPAGPGRYELGRHGLYAQRGRLGPAHRHAVLLFCHGGVHGGAPAAAAKTAHLAVVRAGMVLPCAAACTVGSVTGCLAAAGVPARRKERLKTSRHPRAGLLMPGTGVPAFETNGRGRQAFRSRTQRYSKTASESLRGS